MAAYSSDVRYFAAHIGAEFYLKLFQEFFNGEIFVLNLKFFIIRLEKLGAENFIGHTSHVGTY